MREHGGVQGELVGAGDGVAAGVAPLAGSGRGEGGGVEEEPAGRGVDRRAGEVGADECGVAGAGDGGEVERRLGQAGAGGDVGQDGPLLVGAPRQPLSRVPPPMPMPVVYCTLTLSRWRWSKVERPRSPLRLSQFCAMLLRLEPAGARRALAAERRSRRRGTWRRCRGRGGEAAAQSAAQLKLPASRVELPLEVR